jgi:hypothetical protein
MELFISWSGPRSHAVAQSLRDWFPLLINAVKPWISSSDIDRGARWGVEVAARLQSSKVGIICVTPENLHSDWLPFEAGALSKSVDNARVCPLLIELEKAALDGPMAQFQATLVQRGEFKALVETVNRALGEHSLGEGQLDQAFDVWWPRLEEKLAAIPADVPAVPTSEPDSRKLLAEVRDLVWSLVRTSSVGGRTTPQAVTGHGHSVHPPTLIVKSIRPTLKRRFPGEYVDVKFRDNGSVDVVVGTDSRPMSVPPNKCFDPDMIADHVALVLDRRRSKRKFVIPSLGEEKTPQ